MGLLCAKSPATASTKRKPRLRPSAHTPAACIIIRKARNGKNYSSGRRVRIVAVARGVGHLPSRVAAGFKHSRQAVGNQPFHNFREVHGPENNLWSKFHKTGVRPCWVSCSASMRISPAAFFPQLDRARIVTAILISRVFSYALQHWPRGMPPSQMNLAADRDRHDLSDW